MPPAVHHHASTEGEASLPRLYRPEEIAEALGCSAWWVKDRARRGLIPHTRIGRAYRFTAEHLAETIRLHEERPTRSVSKAVDGPAATSPPAVRTRASQTPRPTKATTPGRLRARPPRRTQCEAVA
ncbi:DNA-binding protein [Streptomyces sp. IMTB 2501]|uniref:helix-turn-helix domain-containing protein n=1 Tax=Streptomyces sp. IMTB 2501 TaxID=1776340 RepID=UPI00096DAB3D|nr:helix-turn-helix domain-containing protein [Streptomyces sp. IMTB 2501]OLZ72833.1 DNA-binding protein [Streptomyces sp. IMTB 2501]